MFPVAGGQWTVVSGVVLVRLSVGNREVLGVGGTEASQVEGGREAQHEASIWAEGAPAGTGQEKSGRMAALP